MLLRDALHYSLWLLTVGLNDIESRSRYLVDEKQIERVDSHIAQIRKMVWALEQELKDI